MNLDEQTPPWAAHVGTEVRKNFQRLAANGLLARFLSGSNILDIGYKGYDDTAHPIMPHAVGIDLDTPGYDGKILPFADQSQDAVFSSHTLEHITDYRQAIREWFRVLRIGGFLIVAVPHQFLYERKLNLPSRFNEDHKRFYTAASLLMEIEEALDPFSYRIRYLEDNDQGFDYSIVPEKHPAGSFEIFLVLEKMRRPDYADSVLLDVEVSPSDATVSGENTRPEDAEGPTLVIRSSVLPVETILVIKLDHRGDFILAKPALQELRSRFPLAKLSLVCGPWNAADALDMEIFDEVLSFEFFREAGNFDAGRPVDSIVNDFDALMSGRKFDLAIDLRVDADTRRLLINIDAAQRAGFDDDNRFPFLDIALPLANPTRAKPWRTIELQRFDSHVCRRESRGLVNDRWLFPGPSQCLIYGPYLDLDAGTYIVEFDLTSSGRRAPLLMDVTADVGRKRLRDFLQINPQRLDPLRFELRIESERKIEFRVFSRPFRFVRPFVFRGCQISTRGGWYGPHQQELMYMLVSMVGLRMVHPFKRRALAA